MKAIILEDTDTSDEDTGRRECERTMGRGDPNDDV
jgi:hypothetical protein